jgi:hypothetical protein
MTVASAPDERAAFDELATLLRSAAVANARARQRLGGTPAGVAAGRQLEHTLDRLALLYGRGTYENLSTAEIVETAVDNELRLADILDEAESAAASRRAQELVDAARRGVRLHIRESAGAARALRGVYVAPLRQEFEQSLWAREEPYLRWRDGVVVILAEDEAEALRDAGDEVDVLFLDPDELLDLEGRGGRPALETELGRRLAAARGTADRIGDSRDRHVTRMLLRQSIVLRNLRDRLADGHPSARSALAPILAAHTELLAARLAAGPASRAVRRDPLGASIDSEREVQELAGRWAAAPGDPAGLRNRFRAVAEAGTRLADLERHQP